MHLRGVVVLGAGAALLAAAPRPTQALASLHTAVPAGDSTAPLVGAVALVAWSLVGYLGLLAVLAATSRLPGRIGSAGSAALQRSAPATVRRALVVVLGIGVVLAPAGVASAGPAAAPPRAAGHTAAAAPQVVALQAAASQGAASQVVVSQVVASQVVSLDWPAVASTAPSVDWPVTGGPGDPVATGAGLTATRAPEAPKTPTPEIPSAEATTPGSTAAAPVGTGPVVVQAGDSLWSLARQSLPPGADDAQVAEAWPAWWSANRELVGDDPHLIHPGQHLEPPVT